MENISYFFMVMYLLLSLLWKVVKLLLQFKMLLLFSIFLFVKNYLVSACFVK